ncbi:MAG: PadR family transcriptional regulator [Saprospiraceae bacterium]|nr:PadR family transcriptional regulator [Saprospiraceae bacterium]
MNPNLLRGSLDTIVIKLLKDHGEMYGYQITQKVKEMTKDGIQLTEGALYPTLHKLEAKGILSVETRMISNRYRKYYRLTTQGYEHAITLLNQMEEYLQQMSLLIKPLKPSAI